MAALSPAQRSLYGRIGAAVARSRHDPRELTAAGRTAFLAAFEAKVRADNPDLPEAEVLRRATELRRAHFLRLAAASSRARFPLEEPEPEPVAFVFPEGRP